MKRTLCLLLMLLPSSGCAVIKRLSCAPNCHAEQRTASSLVNFLYPSGAQPPAQDAIPELRLPLLVLGCARSIRHVPQGQCA